MSMQVVNTAVGMQALFLYLLLNFVIKLPSCLLLSHVDSFGIVFEIPSGFCVGFLFSPCPFLST